MAPAPHAEAEAERMERERALLAEAREDVHAGRVVAGKDVDAWLGLYGRGEPLPMPDSPSMPRVKQTAPPTCLGPDAPAHHRARRRA